MGKVSQEESRKACFFQVGLEGHFGIKKGRKTLVPGFRFSVIGRESKAGQKKEIKKRRENSRGRDKTEKKGVDGFF